MGILVHRLVVDRHTAHKLTGSYKSQKQAERYTLTCTPMAHIHKLRITQTILKTYTQRPDTHQTHTQWTQKTLRYPGIYTK